MDATALTRVGSLAALGSPNFALLWSAQVISSFGDKITIFALAYVTWEVTQSAISTTLAIVITTVPHALFGFFGGAISDAVGHRRAMVACDVVRMIAIAAIPGLLALGASLSLPYALVLVAALCSVVFNPARMAIVPDLVPPERLNLSNSLVYASDRTVEIVGTLVAGALVALMRESAFYVDALTFGLSGLLLMRISMTDPTPRRISWDGLFADALDGARLLRDHAILRANTIFSLLAQQAAPIVNGLTPVLIFRELGLGPEHFGAVEAALAVGAVVAGLLYPMVLGRTRKGRAIVTGFAFLGIVLIAIAFATTFEVTLLLFALLGVANVMYYVPNITLSQEVTPPSLRARVFGARTALLNLTWLPVILLTATLAEVFSVHAILGAAGVFTVLVAVGGALNRTVRDAA